MRYSEQQNTPPHPYERVSMVIDTTEEELKRHTIRTWPLEERDVGQRSRRIPKLNYKPPILRYWSLFSLLVITLALIGLLEYAALRLPHAPSSLNTLDSKAKNTSQILHNLTQPNANNPGQTPVPSSTAISFVAPSGPISSSSVIRRAASLSSVAPSAPAPSAYVQTSSAIADGSTSGDSGPGDYGSGNSGPSISSSGDSGLGESFSSFPSASDPNDGEFVQTGSYSGDSGSSSSSDSSPSASDPNDGEFVKTGSSANGQSTCNTTTEASDCPLPERSRHDYYPWWSGADTFIGTYLATLIAVLYRILWTILYCSFNLIEPFRQLSQPNGAAAELAFFSFYQSRASLLGPIPALMKRRWALALVSLTAMLADLLPAFASESIFVDTNWNCPSPDVSNKYNPCPPKILVDVGVLRILQGILAFAGVVILWQVYLQFFDKTYIPNDPRSMATIASLMRHPDLTKDLNRVPGNATSSEMKSIFRGRRYRLGFYKSSSSEDCYGVQPVFENEQYEYEMVSDSATHQYRILNGSIQVPDRQSPKPQLIRIMDIVLVVLVAGLFGLVLVYYRDSSEDSFNHFFNSDTFGPRFILTLAGTAIAALWKSAEQSSVVFAAYSQLAKRPSSPERTILFNPSISPVFSTVRAIRCGYLSVAAITVVTLLAELGLNVVIGGIAYATGETKQQFVVSTYFSLAILGIMLIVAVALIVSRFREVALPRRPDTLGAVMSYMSRSRMLYDFEGMEYLNESSRNDRIRLMKRKYELKETRVKDGKVAWTVDATDEQPL